MFYLKAILQYKYSNGLECRGNFLISDRLNPETIWIMHEDWGLLADNSRGCWGIITWYANKNLLTVVRPYSWIANIHLHKEPCLISTEEKHISQWVRLQASHVWFVRKSSTKFLFSTELVIYMRRRTDYAIKDRVSSFSFAFPNINESLFRWYQTLTCLYPVPAKLKAIWGGETVDFDHLYTFNPLCFVLVGPGERTRGELNKLWAFATVHLK